MNIKMSSLGFMGNLLQTLTFTRESSAYQRQSTNKDFCSHRAYLLWLDPETMQGNKINIIGSGCDLL